MRKVRFAAAAAALGAVLTGGTFALTTGAATATPTPGTSTGPVTLDPVTAPDG